MTQTPVSMKRLLILLVLATLLVRIAMIGVLGMQGRFSLHDDDYWEYGSHAYYLLAGEGYAYFSEEHRDPYTGFRENVDDPWPSAYMPPGYVCFLVPFLAIEADLLRNLLLIAAHLAASVGIVLLLRRLTRRRFGEVAGLLAGAVYAFAPDQAYLVSSFTPVLLYQLVLLAALLALDRMDAAKPSHGWQPKRALQLGLLLGIGTLLRAEMALLGLLMLAVLALTRRLRPALLAGAVVLLVMAPWQIRNAVVFDAYVPLTTGGGLNLYRGHNPESIAEWSDPALEARLDTLAAGDDWELRWSRLHRDRALEVISEDPVHYLLVRGAAKVAHLWGFFPGDPRARNPVHLVYWFTTLSLGVLGLGLSLDWRRHRYIYLVLIHATLVAALFFALTRYQTTMKVALYPFAGLGAAWLLARVGLIGHRHLPPRIPLREDSPEQ